MDQQNEECECIDDEQEKEWKEMRLLRTYRT